MLRQNYKTFCKKVLPPAPLADAVTSEVVVTLSDPLTGETQERKEFITKVVPQKPSDAVRNEPADLYSIENLQCAGISPKIAPVGGYVKNTLDNYDKVCEGIADIDAMSQPAEPQPTETQSTEPQKTE